MRIKLLLIVIPLLIFNIKFNKKEVVSFTASSFVIQKDSVSINYLNAKKYYDNNDYLNALKVALEILESNNLSNSNELILTNYLIANIYFNTKNNTNAIQYYRRTIKYLHDYNNIKRENKNINHNKFHHISAESLLGLGSSYYRLNRLKNIKKYKDSALFFYNKVDKISFLDKKIFQVKSRAYTNLSVIYMNNSLYDKAKYFALKSIDIHKELKNKVNEAAALGNLSSIYLSENNYDKAKNIYFEALDLIRNIKTNKALEIREGLYYNLAYNLYKLKDYQAYDYQERSYIIKDSLRDNEFRGMIAEITEKYNFDVKKKLLLKEEENKRLIDQRKFWIFVIGSFIIIISLLYWLNIYKLRQKNFALKLSENQLLQDKNIDKIKSEAQVRILNATIDGKESERKEIAETLHDSVSALLSSANLHLQATRNQFNGKTPIEIDKTQDIITEASQKIRDLSHTLVSSVLLKFGLNFALKDMADKYSNSQINFDTDIKKIRRYNESFEVKVYNIMQEFLNNILKHSKAENAMIKLREKNNTIFFTISDDGIGFDKTNIIAKDGLGINQIDARVQMMKGELQIESSINEGTIVNVKLPIIERKEANLF